MSTRTLNRRSRRDEAPAEEEPRRGRRSREDDHDEEPPRRGRRSRDDDDEADNEEPPRRGRRSRDEPDEDEAPKSRRRARDESDEYDKDADDDRPARSSRSSRSKDDEDEAPRRGRGSRAEASPAGRSGGRGWKAFREKRETTTSDYVKNFKYPDEETLTKILDEEPFAVYTEHWLDELSGKKSFGCLSDLGEKCPLCSIGDKPKVYAFFNLLDLSNPDNPVVKPWRVAPTTMDQLEKYAESNKTSPLNRDDLYWSVHKSGGGKAGRVQIHIHPVKERDLLDDWDTDPLTPEELDEFELFTEKDVTEYSSRKDLQEIADDLD